jgi:hypothetical protein
MEVIFLNSIKKIDKILPKINKDTKFINLKYDAQGYEIKKFLVSKLNCGEVELKDILKSSPLDFRKRFVDFVAGLNQENHSLLWWALNFTNKNPITTGLCNKIFYFLIIVKLLEDKHTDNFIVITDDTDLLNQTRLWVKNKGIKVINAINVKFNLKEIVKQFTPLAIIFAFFRTVLFRCCARRYCKFLVDKEKKYMVEMTLINHQSFTKEGNYRDAYFGDFPKYLLKNNISFIILGEILFPPYIDLIKKAIFNRDGFPIIPKEYFLSFLDLLRCLFISLKHYFHQIRLKGKVEINGIDLNYLVKQAIREDYKSTKFFSNLCFYYSVKPLAKEFKIEKFFYPFENRSFEKMIILALRRFSPQTRIIGYQHASISLRHTNFFLEKNEHTITPLPDVILTMGQITKNIMEDKGNFPPQMLRIGCALRQRSFNNRMKHRNGRISNILVALATNIEEYVKVLKFLDSAFQKNDSYNLWIRPHPVFSLDEALEIVGSPTFKFHKANKETLDECYRWADVVLYVHSTLSLEALSRGIPVINIKISNCLNPDPLFDFQDLKWSVDSPEKLIDAIMQIDTLSDGQFSNLQKRAKEYTERYIYPVTESNLKAFLDA